MHLTDWITLRDMRLEYARDEERKMSRYDEKPRLLSAL